VPSAPLTEAALLMQSRKSDADVDSICEICPSLTGAQILKLIKSYTSDDCEDAISPTFIDKLSKKLSEKSEAVSCLSWISLRMQCDDVETFLSFFLPSTQQCENGTFTMDENHVRPLSVVFKYLDIKLEDIEIPDVLKLNGLVTKI